MNGFNYPEGVHVIERDGEQCQRLRSILLRQQERNGNNARLHQHFRSVTASKRLISVDFVSARTRFHSLFFLVFFTTEVDPQFARPPSTGIGIDDSVIWGPAPPELIDLEAIFHFFFVFQNLNWINPLDRSSIYFSIARFFVLFLRMFARRQWNVPPAPPPQQRSAAKPDWPCSTFSAGLTSGRWETKPIRVSSTGHKVSDSIALFPVNEWLNEWRIVSAQIAYCLLSANRFTIDSRTRRTEAGCAMRCRAPRQMATSTGPPSTTTRTTSTSTPTKLPSRRTTSSRTTPCPSRYKSDPTQNISTKFPVSCWFNREWWIGWF